MEQVNGTFRLKKNVTKFISIDPFCNEIGIDKRESYFFYTDIIYHVFLPC